MKPDDPAAVGEEALERFSLLASRGLHRIGKNHCGGLREID